MGTRKTLVPAIPDVKVGDAQSIARAAAASKEAIEVGLGRRGDPLDRFLTVRELQDAGLIATAGDGRGGIAVTGPQAPGGDGGGGAPIFDPDPPDYGADDFTVPPAPRNVSGRGIPPNSIMVTWDPPNYGNHRSAEIFCLIEHPNGSAPTMAELLADLTAAKVGDADGTIFLHRDLVNVVRPGQQPIDAALNPSTRYYWVRFVSFANVRGPLAPLNGAAIQMTLDPVAVLDAMIGRVTASNIYANLRGWFGSLNNDPILAAGGVGPYVRAQDGILRDSINEVRAIIGVNTTGQNITLWQWISSLNATASANSAQLNAIETWQAALALAAGGEPSYLNYTIDSYSGGIQGSSTSVRFNVRSFTGAPVQVGGQFRIAVPDGQVNVFSPLANVTLVASQVVADGSVYYVYVNRGPSNTALPYGTHSFAAGGPNYQTMFRVAEAVQTDFIDFIATVQRNIFVAVDPDTAIAREIGLVRAQIGAVQAETQVLNQAIVRIDGTMDNIWSVRMRQNSGTGLIYSAGFGLGMTTDAAGNSLSTFLINANQFAVMGPTGPGVLVQGYERISATRGRFIVMTEAHGLFVEAGVGQPTPTGPTRVTITVPDENVLSVPPGDGTGDPIPTTNPLLPLRNAELVVRELGYSNGYPWIVLETTGTSPPVMPTVAGAAFVSWTSPSWDPRRVQRLNYAMLPPDNIPFIIDTVRNVVAIRGRLVVNGLIAADAGQFTTLTADTAFIRQLQAQVVNANVVIGQRIIAGTPGTGAITDLGVASISNYIVELSNPVVSEYPLRLYKPTIPGVNGMAFGLDRLGNLFVGGNMSVGGNAVIATTDYTTAQPANATLFSVGGRGGDGDKYALWIGPRGQYGTTGELRREATGLFWVKENGRAGFNADLFLGSGVLALPSVAAQTAANPNPGTTYSIIGDTIRSDGDFLVATSLNPITIRSDRDGRVAPTLVTVSGLLVASGTTGGGDAKMFRVRVALVGSANGQEVTGGLVQEFVQDDYSPECHPFTCSNILQVPAGQYHARITLTILHDKPMAIIRGWNVVAMQVGA